MQRSKVKQYLMRMQHKALYRTCDLWKEWVAASKALQRKVASVMARMQAREVGPAMMTIQVRTAGNAAAWRSLRAPNIC